MKYGQQHFNYTCNKKIQLKVMDFFAIFLKYPSLSQTCTEPTRSYSSHTPFSSCNLKIIHLEWLNKLPVDTCDNERNLVC